MALSDAAGLVWGDESPSEQLYSESYGRPELGLQITYSQYSSGGQNYTAVTVNFPPYQDEAGTTMTLSYELSGSSTEDVTDVAVPSSDHTIRSNLDVSNDLYGDQYGAYAYSSPWSNANPYSAALMLAPDGTNDVTYQGSNGGQDLETLINSDAKNGICNNFELTSGTYDLDEILDIQEAMKLWAAPGSDVNIVFTFQSTASVWDADPSQLFGAINIRSSHVWLEDFGISFSYSNVDLGGNGETFGAIIDDENPLQTACVDVNIQGLTIHAASEVDFGGNLSNDLDPSSLQTVYTIFMGDFDSGTIEDNTIYGGTVKVQFGPWTISGNTFIGSVENTICPNAIGVNSGHDITISGNTLTDPDPAQDGQIERLFTGTNGGYNINISSNNVSDNVGELVFDDNGYMQGANGPEMILPEAYNTDFEGNTAAVSVSSSTSNEYNRRLIAIPSSDLFNAPSLLATGSPGTLVLFILDGSSAGTSITVSQVIANGDSTSFVLNSPLPQGTFDFSIDPTYDIFTVSGNSINTSGTASAAVVLPSAMADVQVNDNDFIGDETTTWNGQYSEAVRLSPQGVNAGSSSLGSFNNPGGDYSVSYTPIFGLVISGNNINNPIGGIQVYNYLLPQYETTYGRTYVFAAISDNSFSYSYSSSNISVIHMGDSKLPCASCEHDVYSELVDGTTVAYDSSAAYFVDPRQISVTMSGNTIDWVNVSPAPYAVEVDATEVNGVLYDGPSYSTPSSPALLATGASPSVNLSSYYGAVGITTPGSTVEGNADRYGNSLSSQALGSTVSWKGQTFDLGPANRDDIVLVGGQTIAIPQGSYTALDVLGMATGYSEAMGGVFTIQYTNGSFDEYTLGISDWMTGYTGTAGTTAPGESVVATMYSDDGWNGTEDVAQSESGGVYVYGYVIPVNPSLTLESLVLPNNQNIKILAIDAVDEAGRTNLGSVVGDTSTDNRPVPDSAIGITENDNTGVGGINTSGVSLSNSALATASDWTSGQVDVWDGQTFTVGPVAVNDIVEFQGQTIHPTEGEYTNLLILATSDAPSGPQAATITVYYTNGSYDTFNQVISNVLSGYTGAGTTAPGESIAVAMDEYNTTWAGTTSGDAYLYGYDFALNPSKTVASISLSNNQNMAIYAMDLVDLPPQVNLNAAPDDSSTAFNQVGISVDIATGGASFDSNGDSYSADALDNATNWTSGQTDVWAGQTFSLGGTLINDLVEFTGQTIALPAGQYSEIMILAMSAASGGAQAATITVNYTGDSYVTYDQDFSSFTSATTEPGESIAVTMPYYNNKTTGKVSTTAYLYAFSFPLNETKTVASLLLSDDSAVKLFAIDLLDLPPQVNLNAAPDDSSTAFNQVGIAIDGAAENANLDGGGHSYSAEELGNSVIWDGQVFDIGSAVINDVIEAMGQTITLPAGYVSDLLLLGAAVNGVQSNQSFIVNYANGTHSTITQTFSDWVTGYDGTGGTTAPGESIAEAPAHYDYWNGSSSSEIDRTNYVYGYDFEVNSSAVIVSITLPTDSDVKILAIDEVYDGGSYEPQFVTGGTGSAVHQSSISPTADNVAGTETTRVANPGAASPPEQAIVPLASPARTVKLLVSSPNGLTSAPAVVVNYAIECGPGLADPSDQVVGTIWGTKRKGLM